MINRTVNQFGEFERINSNQADFIPTSTCCGEYLDRSRMIRSHGVRGSSGLAKIIQYDEQNFEQEDIEPGSFFYRVCSFSRLRSLSLSTFVLVRIRLAEANTQSILLLTCSLPD